MRLDKETLSKLRQQYKDARDGYSYYSGKEINKDTLQWVAFYEGKMTAIEDMLENFDLSRKELEYVLYYFKGVK